MSRMSETPKGVMETYDWQDVAEDLQERIDKARKMIFDNYGVLDKYGIEMLDDILKGDSDYE